MGQKFGSCYTNGNVFNDDTVNVRFVQINDVYKLDHLARFATCKSLSENDPGLNLTIAVLPGDFLSPSLLSSLDKGESMVNVLNMAGMDFVCFGNHEADIQLHQLFWLIGKQVSAIGGHLGDQI